MAQPIARSAAGFTIFEVLVTLAIITVWLLATAGVQSVSARLNKTAQYRSEAVFLANEMAERIEANKATAATGGYDGYAITCPTTAPTTCTAGACTGAQLATFDQAEWASRVCTTLPGATGSLTYSGTAPPSYAITLGWNDRRDERTYTDTSSTNEVISFTATKVIYVEP